MPRPRSEPSAAAHLLPDDPIVSGYRGKCIKHSDIVLMKIELTFKGECLKTDEQNALRHLRIMRIISHYALMCKNLP